MLLNKITNTIVIFHSKMLNLNTYFTATVNYLLKSQPLLFKKLYFGFILMNRAGIYQPFT